MVKQIGDEMETNHKIHIGRLHLAIISAVFAVIFACMSFAVMAETEEQGEPKSGDEAAAAQINTGTDGAAEEARGEAGQGVVREGNAGEQADEHNKVIEDGEYIIYTGLNELKAVDVAAGSTKNGANVQVYDTNVTPAQKFSFTYHKDGKGGYYEIRNSASGKTMDIAWADKSSGANVWMYDANGTAAQRWILLPAGNGFYVIKSLLSGMCLDVACGQANNGANIWAYSPNGTAAQRFKLVKPRPDYVIDNGVYRIISALDENKAVESKGAGMADGTNLQLGYSDGGSTAQKFIIQKIGGGIYRIYSCASGKVVDVQGAGKANGTNVWLYSLNDSNAQRWYIRNTGDGYIYFTSVLSGNNIDVAGASSEIGTNIWTYSSNGTYAQRFKLVAADYRPVEDGVYVIRNSANNNMVVDIRGGDRRVMTNADIYEYNGTDAQKFRITRGSDGFYTIQNVKSGHVLDVEGGRRGNGANITQYSSNYSNAQKWIIRRFGDLMSFISACSSKVLDIQNGALRNFANLQQYQYNGSNAQKFALEKTDYDHSWDGKRPDYAINPYVSTFDFEAERYSYTCIFINIASQTLKYFRGGAVMLSTPVITGKPGTPTPTGYYTLRSKARNIVLRGPGYASPVKYWLAFIGSSYGMHDASWQDDTSYGGNLYLYRGSHGCVNTPYWAIKQLYDYVPIGTGVIIR